VRQPELPDARKTKGTYKLDLTKYCPTCRKHVEHKEKKK
jgi:ribosomal protein L33